MAPAVRLARDGARSFREDDDEYSIPRETFEISDPSFENRVPRRYGVTFWGRWLDMAIRSRRKQRLDADEEEGDGLLYGTDVSGVEIVPRRTQRSCIHWCIYGGNTALSIL
jgi:hypothetical protein